MSALGKKFSKQSKQSERIVSLLKNEDQNITFAASLTDTMLLGNTPLPNIRYQRQKQNSPDDFLYQMTVLQFENGFPNDLRKFNNPDPKLNNSVKNVVAMWDLNKAAATQSSPEALAELPAYKRLEEFFGSYAPDAIVQECAHSGNALNLFSGTRHLCGS